MDPIPASIPFHVARAYGLGTRPATQIEPKPQVSSAAKAASAASVAKLVAATVAGPVRFNTVDTNASTPAKSSPAQQADSFPLYRHPADKNAAATSINAGRALDTQA
jgi:hypothetical protein